MGEGDMMPSGSYRRHYDPKYAAKVKQGGKKADEIRKLAEEHHEKLEAPRAEDELQKALQKIENQPKNQKSKNHDRS